MAARKLGDRRDGTLIRKIDSMHFIMPLIYPNRCDNEAYISEKIDLTNAAAFLDKKNAADPEFKYTLFHLIVAAILKTVYLRPKLNRFIVNGNTYQRNELSAAFVVKKIFSDNGEEGLAFVKACGKDDFESIHQAIFEQVSFARKGDGKDGSTESMDLFNKMPRFLSKFLVKCVCVLDRHGKVPQSLIASDPYYQTVVLTNLGSIKLHSGYHHLTNWGTNSLFLTVGERKLRPFTDRDGNTDMRDSIDIGLIIDERLADGYYYSRSVALFLKLLQDPELLEMPFDTEVEI